MRGGRGAGIPLAPVRPPARPPAPPVAWAPRARGCRAAGLKAQLVARLDLAMLPLSAEDAAAEKVAAGENRSVEHVAELAPSQSLAVTARYACETSLKVRRRVSGGEPGANGGRVYSRVRCDSTPGAPLSWHPRAGQGDSAQRDR